MGVEEFTQGAWAQAEVQGGLAVGAPWSLRPGQLLGSAVMERPQGSPQPPVPAGGTVVTDFPGLLRRLSELLQIKPQGAVSVLGIISVVSIGVVSIQII